MDVMLGDPQRNAEAARRLVAGASGQGAALVVLPELWATGYDLEHAQEQATPLTEGMGMTLCTWARNHRIHIIGSVLEAAHSRIYNTAVVVSPEGVILASYRKIHLFGLMGEDRYLSPGEAPTLVNLPWGLTGLAICYDLRFPELFRSYALGGARLVVIPAEWPAARLEHWRVLVRARAIENQLFVVACNRSGTSRNERFAGHSLVVDPWGRVLAEARDEPHLLTATLDMSEVDTVRSSLPALHDRRPSAYG
jgi:predicted amidohydrolase